MKQKILRILPFVATALVMALIFYLSSQNKEQSSELSSGITKGTIDFFASGASAEEKKKYLVQFHGIIRKCAHFVLYAMLGFSALGMFVGKKKIHMWLSAVSVCFLYAVSDEIHQAAVAGRSPMVRDVIIDTCGGGFGAAVLLLIFFIYMFRKERKR